MASVNWDAVNAANKKAAAQQPLGLPTVQPQPDPYWERFDPRLTGSPVATAPFTPPPPLPPTPSYTDVYGTANGNPYGVNDSNPSSPGFNNPGYWDLVGPPAPPARPAPAATGGGGNPRDLWTSWYASSPAKPRQSQNTSLQPFVDHLTAQGINAQVNVDPHGFGKGININGQFVKLLDGYDNPIWEDYSGGAGGGGGDVSSYMAQFSDPSTKLLEQYLTQQMGTLSAQQQAQQQANAGLRAKMPDIQAATDRLVAYLNQRATSLQGAPYTGTEQEILRTQALEPIERDRTAANKRALEQIGARGLTPESGIAMGMQNDVNSVFDRQRAGAQGDLAYRTINEQRSRGQEAQQLLGMVPQVQRAGATGDLSFLQSLDAAVNSLGSQGINLATANQRLPSQAMSDALSVMGMGGSSPDSVFQQAMGLYGAQNQKDQQGLGYYQMLGSMLPYLMGNR